MDRKSHFNHFVRNIVQLVAYLVPQFPPECLARFDRDKLISAFSMVADGTRIGAKPWPLGPGWSGHDTKIGSKTSPSPETMDPVTLALRFNSDVSSSAPYGNKRMKATMEDWAKDKPRWSRSIPVCVVSENLESSKVLGGRPMPKNGA